MNKTWIRHMPAFIRQKLEGRHSLQQAIGNTGWLFADRIARMGVNLVVGVWLARYLGPEKLGLLSYATAFVALFSPLASLGLEDIAVRDLVRDPECKDETLGTAFILKLIGGSALFVVAICTIFFLRRCDSQLQWLVGIIAAGSIFQAFNIIECWFNSQVHAKYTVFDKSAAFFLCSVIKIILLIKGASLIAFAWVITFEVAAGSLGLVVAYKSKIGPLGNWQGTLKRARSLLKDSWPLIFSFMAIVIYQRIDQIMIGEMVGSEEVGIYSVAVRLAEVWIFIPTAVFWTVFPSIIKAKAVSDEQFYLQLQKFYNLMALLAYAVAIPVSFIAQWLVVALYGEAYARAGMMLIVLTWASLFMNLEYARSAFLNTMNLNRIYLIAVVTGGILNVILNYILIPRYGGMGAAIASLIAYWFAAHGACFFFKPLFRTGTMLTRAMLYPKIW
jgi:O-antigen/teichoic acid export membrane protein